MEKNEELRSLDPGQGLWERFFTVAPLVVVGSKDGDGQWNLAPKHLAMPASWGGHFVFVCTPAHATYQNIRQNGRFTVTYVRPNQVLFASLAAAPRCDSGEKVEMDLLPTFATPDGEGVLLRGGYAYLSCEVMHVIDGLDANSLIVGKVTAAWAAPESVRDHELDDAEILAKNPLAAYLHPGRYAEIGKTHAFPFTKGFKR